jgi:uncharacterized phage-associated protein
MTATTHDIAAAVVGLAGPVDPMKLQKLVFLAAGDHLVFTGGEPMFDEPIEAWEHGPVVHSLYDTLRVHGKGTVESIPTGDATRLTAMQRSCVRAVVQRFGAMSALQLRNLTHLDRAWADSYIPGRRRTVIPNDRIHTSFAARRRMPVDTVAYTGDMDTAAGSTMRGWPVVYSQVHADLIARLIAKAKPSPSPTR